MKQPKFAVGDIFRSKSGNRFLRRVVLIQEVDGRYRYFYETDTSSGWHITFFNCFEEHLARWGTKLDLSLDDECPCWNSKKRFADCHGGHKISLKDFQ